MAAFQRIHDHHECQRGDAERCEHGVSLATATVARLRSGRLATGTLRRLGN
jgi:hypothetical protein